MGKAAPCEAAFPYCGGYHHPRQITTSTDQRKAQHQADGKYNRMNRAKEGPKPVRALLWQGGRARPPHRHQLRTCTEQKRVLRISRIPATGARGPKLNWRPEMVWGRIGNELGQKTVNCER